MDMRILSSLLGALLTMSVIGCEGGSGYSNRGESCRWRNDCKSGLACIGGVCTQNDFPIEMTAKSCDLIECSTDQDCCDPDDFPSTCPEWDELCEGGDEFACDNYDTFCVCRERCREDRCVFHCTSDSDCGIGSCVAGRCVLCEVDDDCDTNEVCDDGFCEPACTTRNDCPYFHDCQAGRCVETGCDTDRECVAYTGNPRALCREGECKLPCENDAECNAFGYDFMDCVEGECVYVGCDSDEECRIRLDLPPGSSVTAVCR